MPRCNKLINSVFISIFSGSNYMLPSGIFILMFTLPVSSHQSSRLEGRSGSLTRGSWTNTCPGAERASENPSGSWCTGRPHPRTSHSWGSTPRRAVRPRWQRTQAGSGSHTSPLGPVRSLGTRACTDNVFMSNTRRWQLEKTPVPLTPVPECAH